MANTAPTHGNTNGGAIDHQDVEGWKQRTNDFLARPSEVIKSKSPQGASSWFNSFFGCFSPVDTCLITCCCPCVTFGKTHHRIHKDATLKGYEPINTSCLLFLGASCFGIPCLPTAMERQSLREKYNVEGSFATDLGLAYCCGCCTLVQNDKEAEYREGLLATQQPEVQQYQGNNAGMTYPEQPAIAGPPVTDASAPVYGTAPVASEKH